MTRVLGLDIGGSTTRARLTIDGAPAAEAQTPSASWTAVGPDRAGEALREALARVLGADRRPPDAVCAGAAGSATPGARAWLTRALTELTGAPRITVVDDAALILPAAGHDTGIAVICGTGSVVHGTDDAHAARGGGWGYLLGDEGGGYWLVRAALRTLLQRRDRGAPLGGLGEALCPGGDLDALLADAYADPRPRAWAAHAPAVLECDDDGAQRLLRRGADALAATTAGVAERLDAAAGPIVLAGGLVAHPRVQEMLRAALYAALPRWTAEVLRAPPVAGAVALAQRSLPRAGS